MRFDVPQFIDVEDKIFGPLTFRQFAYVTGGAGLSYVLYKVLPLYLSILIIIPVAALAAALAFYKFNGKPFINLLESFFAYAVRDKLYIWKKSAQKKKKAAALAAAGKTPAYTIPKITESKLHDISWGLDVLDTKRPESN